MGIKYTNIIGDQTQPGFFLTRADFTDGEMTPWHSNSKPKLCLVWSGDVLKERRVNEAQVESRRYPFFSFFRHGVGEVLRDGPNPHMPGMLQCSVLIAGFGPNVVKPEE